MDLTSNAMLKLARGRHIELALNRAGEPMQNGFVGAFVGRVQQRATVPQLSLSPGDPRSLPIARDRVGLIEKTFAVLASCSSGVPGCILAKLGDCPLPAESTPCSSMHMCEDRRRRLASRPGFQGRAPCSWIGWDSCADAPSTIANMSYSRATRIVLPMRAITSEIGSGGRISVISVIRALHSLSRNKAFLPNLL